MNSTHHYNSIHRYYRSEFNALLVLLKKVKQNPAEEPVHQLRLTVKRMRALFAFFELLFPEKFNSKKYNASIRTIFKAAGIIREQQLNQHLALSVFPALSVRPYVLYLRKREKIAKKKFAKISADIDLKALYSVSLKLKKYKKSFSEINIHQQLNDFMYMETLKMKQLFTANADKKTIHSIRIELKKLDAIASLLQKTDSDPEKQIILRHTKYLGNLIGDWHNKIVLLDSMEQFYRKKKDKAGVRFGTLVASFSDLKTIDPVFFESLRSGITQLFETVHSVNSGSFSV